MMLSRFLNLTSTLLLVEACLAAAAAVAPEAKKQAVHVEQIIELPKPSWLENIAVRSNGQILASRLDKAELYLVNPANGEYSVIATFPGVTSAWGIAEYAPDVYAVGIGNFTTDGFESVPHTYSIQSIDLSKGLDAYGKVTPKLLANTSKAFNLNGLTFRAPYTLYASDSFAYKIWEIDTRTGAYKAVVEHEPLLTGGRTLDLGVNGLKWSERERALFFANTDQALVGVIAQRPDGSFAPARKLASNPANDTIASSYDDFALDAKDDFYIATNLGNTVNFIARSGSPQVVLAGSKNSSQVAGPTSAQFGRTPADSRTLYVVTNGGLASPINGTVFTGAKVLAIKGAY